MTRLGIPFCTGILHENDVDFYVAKNLASDLISVPAFEENKRREPREGT